MKKETIKTVVKHLLETDIKCRYNNEYLILKVYEYYGLTTNLTEIAELPRDKKISFRTISRVSAKWRSTYKHLNVDEDTLKLMNDKQDEFKEINSGKGFEIMEED